MTGRLLRLVLGLVLVAILALAGWRILFGGGAGPRLVLRAVEGPVRRRGIGGRALPAEPGAVVGVQERIETGQGGSAVLAVGEGAELRLEAGSSLRVLGADETGVRVELDGGRVEAHVTPVAPELTVAAGGRAARARDADFRVGVDAGGGVAIETLRGEVALSGMGEATALGAGERALALPGRDPVIDAVAEELLLNVRWPEEAAAGAEARLAGRTAPYAEVAVAAGDGAPVRVRAGPDGRFEARVPLPGEAVPVAVEARDPMGRRRREERVLGRDASPPTLTEAEVQWSP